MMARIQLKVKILEDLRSTMEEQSVILFCFQCRRIDTFVLFYQNCVL